MRNYRLPLALALTAAALAGCLGPANVVPMRLYTLDPGIQVEENARTGLTLGLRPLRAAQPYSRKMAYLAEDNRIAYRAMDEWAEGPSEVVTRALIEALSGTRAFADVGDAGFMARPDLMLTGEIRKYHEDRTEAPPRAHLEVRIEMREARGAAALLAETLRIREPMDGETAADFAAAMERAVAKLAAAAAQRMAAAAERHAP